MLPLLRLPPLPPLALATLSRPSATLDAQDDSDGPKAPKAGAFGKPTSHPLAIEQAAAARASKDFAKLHTTVQAVLAKNADATNATKLLLQLKRELDGTTDKQQQAQWVAQQIVQVSRFNAQQLTRSVGVQVPDLLDAKQKYSLVKQALAGVRGVPRDIINRIAPDVRHAIETGERGKSFTDAVQAKLGVAEQQARKIAIGTVIRANSSLTEERHKALGITEYVWHCSPDRHTRPWHRKLNTKRFQYAEPPIGGGGGPYDVGNPGSADRCRCQAIPVIPERIRALRRTP